MWTTVPNEGSSRKHGDDLAYLNCPKHFPVEASRPSVWPHPVGNCWALCLLRWTRMSFSNLQQAEVLPHKARQGVEKDLTMTVSRKYRVDRCQLGEPECHCLRGLLGHMGSWLRVYVWTTYIFDLYLVLQATTKRASLVVGRILCCWGINVRLSWFDISSSRQGPPNLVFFLCVTRCAELELLAWAQVGGYLLKHGIKIHYIHA